MFTYGPETSEHLKHMFKTVSKFENLFLKFRIIISGSWAQKFLFITNTLVVSVVKLVLGTCGPVQPSNQHLSNQSSCQEISQKMSP